MTSPRRVSMTTADEYITAAWMHAESASLCSRCLSPAPFEQHDTRRYAYVQGRHTSRGAGRHRNRNQDVAMAGHVLMQPSPFTAQDDCCRRGEFHTCIRLVPALVQSVNPV